MNPGIKIALIVGTVSVAAVMFLRNSAPPSGERTAMIGEWGRVSLDMLGCTSAERTDSLNSILRSGDAEAWKRGAAASVLLNECRQFKPGDEVYIAGKANYMAQVRPRGDPGAYWLNASAIITK